MKTSPTVGQILWHPEVWKEGKRMIQQAVLPVIADWKIFERFLYRDFGTWCILMDFHINHMEELVQRLHARQKKVIVHMDLTHGIANDPYGAQFMCQRLHVDGIISTKPKTIEAAKSNHCIAILRVFMIDSRSFLKSVQMAEALQPDYVEILPAVLGHIVEQFHQYCDIPIIGGGMIRSKEDICRCLEEGMQAVSTSRTELWEGWLIK